MSLLGSVAAAGRAAKAHDFRCCCGHDAIDHAWGARRCKEPDSYGVRCTCPSPLRCEDDEDDDGR